jgi:hypothetical protein|tara:strand:+ start:102 stop:560 length:459 start_codon:yes stop_codon:yes gene_type:complete
MTYKKYLIVSLTILCSTVANAQVGEIQKFNNLKVSSSLSVQEVTVAGKYRGFKVISQSGTTSKVKVRCKSNQETCYTSTVVDGKLRMDFSDGTSFSQITANDPTTTTGSTEWDPGNSEIIDTHEVFAGDGWAKWNPSTLLWDVAVVTDYWAP